MLFLPTVLVAVAVAVAAGSAALEPIVTAIPMSSHLTNDQQVIVPVGFDISVESQDIAFLPYELAIVLDVSGSMQGEPLQKAKEAIVNLIENMAKDDVIHLIKYSDSADVVWRNGVSKDKEWMLRTINEITADGNTNLFSGVSKGFEVLTKKDDDDKGDDNGDKKVSTSDRRIFLFSDGHVNVGVTDHKQIRTQIAVMCQESRIITSAFGVGTGFDRALMTSIAEFGKGNFFFIENPSKMNKILDTARRDIQSIFGYDAKLRFYTENLDNPVSSEYFKVSVKRSFQGRRREHVEKNSIAVKDLRIGDTKHYLVELIVDAYLPKSDHKDDTRVQLLKWDLEYIEKSSNSNKIVQGIVEAYVTNEQWKEKEFMNNDIQVRHILAIGVESHSDMVGHLEKNNYVGAEREKKKLAEQTKILKDFIKENKEDISKETEELANIQMGRYDKVVFNTESLQSDPNAVYSNMAVQLLNEEASDAHNDL